MFLAAAYALFVLSCLKNISNPDVFWHLSAGDRLLAAGLDGIRNRIEPPEPFQGDIGHLTPEEIARYDIGFLPRTLPEALGALEADDVIGAALGSTILEHFLIVKRQELAQYNIEVHPWERAMYLELV